MVVGAAIAGAGFFLLGYIDNFAQFTLIRLTLVTLGDAMMGYMVVNVVIAQWFVRQRGRAFAFTSMGVGFAKVCMPILAAWLLLSLGWRQTWMVFGVLCVALLLLPALLIIKRRPEDAGLFPDGADHPPIVPGVTRSGSHLSEAQNSEVTWTRAEAVHTSAFWLLVVTFGISSVGVTGLNLHVYPYVTDIGHSPVIAATVMSVIASMQLASPLAWGFLAERIDPRIAAMLRFIVQGIGLALAISTSNLICLYVGFFLYGIGLGGNMVLPDLLWASYFGRRSLGKIRGMGLLISQVLAASGPPFFGFLFDITGGYGLSFALFGAALVTSAVLSLLLRPPRKAQITE